MSSAFGAVRGRAVYKLELDDTGVRSKIQGFTSELQRSNFALTNTSKNAGALSNNFRQLNTNLSPIRSSVGSFNSSVGALPKTLDQTGSAADKAGKKLKGIGEAFRGNKGLVFGFAGLASAAAEGIGMIGMWSDAVTRQKEAQEALNIAVAKYGEDSKQATDAQAEYQKQTRFAGMMTRNLVLSQMDQVFFGTMVISQLSQMNLRGGVLGKTIGGIKKGFDLLKGSIIATTTVSTAATVQMGALSTASVGAGASMNGAALSARGLATAIGLIAAPLATAKAAMDILPKTEEFKKNEQIMKDHTKTIRENLEAEKRNIEHLLQSFDITNMDTWATALSNIFSGRSEQDLRNRLDEINAALNNLSLNIDEPLAPSLRLKNGMIDLGNSIHDITPEGPKLASSLDAVSNEMLGILPYSERMNELFKVTSAEVELTSTNVENMIDPVKELRMALASIGQETQGVTIDINHMNKVFKDQKLFYEAFHKVWGNFSATAGNVSTETEKVGDSMIQTATAAANLQNMIQGDIEVLEGMDQAMADAAVTGSEFNKLMDTLSQGRSLETALDIKMDEDKITKKLLDYMPDSISKDIKLEIKGAKSIAAAKRSFEEIFAIGADELNYDDAGLDDVVKGAIKYLKEKLPNAPGSKELQEDLAATIAGDDTEEKVKELIGKWNGLDVDLTGNVTNIKFDLDNLKNIKSDKGNGSGSSEIEQVFEGGLEIPVTMSADSSEVEKKIGDVSTRITNLKNVNPVLATKTDKVYNQIESVRKRIMSIEDLEPHVTVHVGLSGPGVAHLAKGGVFSFAKGGIISAANGYTEESAGPQLVLMGDNPGGHETHAFIPHNNPEPIMNTLNSKFGGSGDGGDVHIHNHFFDREVLQSYQRNNGRLMSRFGSRGSL